MTGRIEMRERMSILRILAASEMTAGETYAKLIPRGPERKALLAAVGARFHVLYLAEMFTTRVHVQETVIGWDAKQLAALGYCGLTKQANRWPAAAAKPRTRDVRVERRVKRHACAR